MTSDLRDQLQQTLGSALTIERELGGGGMSRVFVATDTALDRQIVVKMVPSAAAPSVSVERFNREIRVAAKLQHPHIVPVLSAGESGGLPFYTMPFVQGESLRQRLAKGGELSVNETVHILRDIASALAYAHGQGVVHRDIKPENVMLSGGVAVVTDFGVAKAMDVATTAGGQPAGGLTSLGVALGTPAYMSPEQATADPHVDHRSDIYSFGCVAYEMLAGSSPFAGRTPQQLLSAHVQEAVEPLPRRRASVPPPLAALVMKCLEKRAGDRPQSAEEVLAALDAIATPSGGMSPTAARMGAVPMRSRWLFAVAAVVVLAVVGAFVMRGGRAPAPMQVTQAVAVASGADIEIEPAISPDGKMVAYMSGLPGQERIYVRRLSGGRPVPLSGELSGSHHAPSWSPDGESIIFTWEEIPFGAQAVAANAAYVVPAAGGTPRLLFSSDSGVVADPSYSPDGRWIAYGDDSGLRVRAADGGGAARLVLQGRALHSVAWSPNGRMLAFARGNPSTLANVSVASIGVVSVDGGEQIPVTDAAYVNSSPAWSADGGSLLFVSNRDGTPDVFRQAMRSNGRPAGEPARLTTGLYARSISLSADGSRLAYDVVRNRSNVWSVTIPPSGTAQISAATQVTSGYERVEGMRVSHDGNWLVFDSDRFGNSDIFKVRLDGSDPIQLTRTVGNEFSPAWSPDDREIAYHAARDGNRDIYIASADGSQERRVTSGPRQDYWPDWSPDGRSLVLVTNEGSAPWRSYVTERPRGREEWLEPRPITPNATLQNVARWAPAGDRIALVQDGRVVTALPAGGNLTPLVDMREAGERASFCAWSDRDGKLYFNTQSEDGRYSFWFVPATGGTPRLLLRDEPGRRLGRWDFDADGRRLFFTIAADESDVWVAEVKR